MEVKVEGGGRRRFLGFLGSSRLRSANLLAVCDAPLRGGRYLAQVTEY